MANRHSPPGPRVRRFAVLLLCILTGSSLSAATLEVMVRNAAGQPVEDAAVVLQPEKAVGRKLRKKAVIEQVDREFRPYLTIIEQGTAVEFPNRDPFKHHVYSFSPPNVFEIKLYSDKPANPVTFDKPGEVVLGCNIHDWMQAHVLVVDTPWFAKTGADGRARLERLPPGAFQLRLWHPRQRQAVPLQPMTLSGDETRTLRLQIEAEPRPVVKKPPLDSESY